MLKKSIFFTIFFNFLLLSTISYGQRSLAYLHIQSWSDLNEFKEYSSDVIYVGELDVLKSFRVRYLKGLESVSRINLLNINLNSALSSLKGLHNLRNIRELRVTYNSVLENLNGLESITEINRIHIADNDVFNDISVLKNININWVEKVYIEYDGKVIKSVEELKKALAEYSD